jgi:ATP adenylyltransferase
MAMNQLWAPWRQSYVTAAKRPGTEPCFLCQAATSQEDRAHLVVLRNDHGLVMLNRFPYNNGHLLIAPRLHLAKLQEFPAAELLGLMEMMQTMTGLLDALLQPEGYNVGLNLGAAAGAGLPGHLHWHVVPRWQGDTNFMPLIADTKVITQSLDSLYDALTARLRGPAS